MGVYQTVSKSDSVYTIGLVASRPVERYKRNHFLRPKAMTLYPYHADDGTHGAMGLELNRV